MSWETLIEVYYKWGSVNEDRIFNCNVLKNYAYIAKPENLIGYLEVFKL